MELGGKVAALKHLQHLQQQVEPGVCNVALLCVASRVSPYITAWTGYRGQLIPRFFKGEYMRLRAGQRPQTSKAPSHRGRCKMSAVACCDGMLSLMAR